MLIDLVVSKKVCTFALLKRNAVLTFLILILILYLLFNLTEAVVKHPQLFSKKKFLKYLVIPKIISIFASWLTYKTI